MNKEHPNYSTEDLALAVAFGICAFFLWPAEIMGISLSELTLENWLLLGLSILLAFLSVANLLVKLFD